MSDSECRSSGPTDRAILDAIFEHSSDGLLLIEDCGDGDFRYRRVGAAVGEMLGIDPEGMVGRRPEDIFDAAIAGEFSEVVERVVETGETDIYESVVETEDATLTTRSTLEPIEGPEGERMVMVVAEDVTDVRQARERLEKDHRAVRELYEVAGQSDLELEEQLGRLLEIGCERLELPFGFLTDISDGTQTIRESVGTHPKLQPGEAVRLENSYCRKVVDSDRSLVAFRDVLEEEFDEHDEAYELFGLGCYVGAKVVIEDEFVGTVCFADRKSREHEFGPSELTFVRLLGQWIGRELERERLFDRLEQRARTDGLTGLLNHETLVERLAEECERARRYDHPLSFFLLDLDRFKRVNDRYGHLAGDEVLREVADALRAVTRDSDVVGRYGGEEFGIVAPQTDLEDAERLAERLRERIAQIEVEAEDRPISVSCSVGVTKLLDEETGPDELIRRADTALYDAKSQGRDRVRIRRTEAAEELGGISSHVE